MPTAAATQTQGLKATTTVWSGLATGDDGAPVSTEGKNLSVQAIGTTFNGSTITMHGSNDGVTYAALNDQAVPGNACSFTSVGFKGVLQMPKFIKPVVTGGTGVGLSVVLFNT